MDLSAIIFVVLALAWAVYLIPKALQHHDEMASDRLVEGHTDKVRILSRRRAGQAEPEVVEVEVEHIDTVERTTVLPVADQPALQPALRPAGTRAAAHKAAQRRRRVLGVLLGVLAVVVGLAAFVVVPWWSVAIPASLVVAFLVVARLSVRKTQQRPRPVAHASPTARPAGQAVEGPDADAVASAVDGAAQLLDQIIEKDASDVQQAEELLADDGSLWDPLPMTLPTYVNKARARRTVRTIELTGINSSGHDDADTALAREAEEAESCEGAGAPEAGRVAGM